MTDKPAARMVYKTLDGWRGFASLWVVAYHMVLFIVSRSPDLRTNPVYGFSLLGHLGVQLFFVISGFCIVNAAVSSMRRDNSFLKFVQARLHRLYPPLWFALLAAGLLSIMTTGLMRHGILKASVLGQRDLLHQGFLYFFGNLTLTAIFLHQPLLLVVCWTLCYEVCFYAIVALFLLFKRQLNGRGVLNGLNLVTTIMLCILILAPGLRRFPFDLWPEFGLGVLIYDLLQNGAERAPKIWAALIGLLFLAFAALRDYPIGAWPNSSRETFLVSLAFAALLYALHRYDEALARKTPIRWMAALGAFSYSLYLTHVLSLGIIHQGFKILHLPDSWHVVSFVVAIALALAVARVFHQFCERPFIRSASHPAVVPAASARQPDPETPIPASVP